MIQNVDILQNHIFKYLDVKSLWYLKPTNKFFYKILHCELKTKSEIKMWNMPHEEVELYKIFLNFYGISRPKSFSRWVYLVNFSKNECENCLQKKKYIHIWWYIQARLCKDCADFYVVFKTDQCWKIVKDLILDVGGYTPKFTITRQIKQFFEIENDSKIKLYEDTMDYFFYLRKLIIKQEEIEKERKQLSKNKQKEEEKEKAKLERSLFLQLTKEDRAAKRIAEFEKCLKESSPNELTRRFKKKENWTELYIYKIKHLDSFQKFTKVTSPKFNWSEWFFRFQFELNQNRSRNNTN